MISKGKKTITQTPVFKICVSWLNLLPSLCLRTAVVLSAFQMGLISAADNEVIKSMYIFHRFRKYEVSVPFRFKYFYLT